MRKILLASRSKVRAEILKKSDIRFDVLPSNIDEDPIKKSLISEGANPELVSKNLAELKANSVSQRNPSGIVLGADSVIDLDGELISKPLDRTEALKILIKLNGKTHQLISSVCLSLNGNMIWNYSDKSVLTMKNMSEKDLKIYLSKIPDSILYAYNVYQIEGIGKSLFSNIKGDNNSIMGLPIKQITTFLKGFKC